MNLLTAERWTWSVVGVQWNCQDTSLQDRGDEHAFNNFLICFQVMIDLVYQSKGMKFVLIDVITEGLMFKTARPRVASPGTVHVTTTDRRESYFQKHARSSSTWLLCVRLQRAWREVSPLSDVVWPSLTFLDGFWCCLTRQSSREREKAGVYLQQPNKPLLLP